MKMLENLRNPIQIEGCPGEGSYLTRWHLIGSPASAFHVMLHRFNRSDRDRETHDHPWDFISVILWGGYTEVTPDGRYRQKILRDGGESVPEWFAKWTHASLKSRRFYWPGSILFSPARWAHRIEIEPGKKAWSLVIAFKKKRSWGFFTREGWTPWRKFTSSRDCA